MLSALDLYRDLCVDLPSEDLARLRSEVRVYYQSLLDAQQTNELIAIDLAEALCVRLDGLLAMAHMVDGDTRSAIVGAARYFISSDDEAPDTASCTGLDDDVAVFNHVVRLIERQDLVISD